MCKASRTLWEKKKKKKVVRHGNQYRLQAKRHGWHVPMLPFGLRSKLRGVLQGNAEYSDSEINQLFNTATYHLSSMHEADYLRHTTELRDARCRAHWEEVHSQRWICHHVHTGVERCWLLFLRASLARQEIMNDRWWGTSYIGHSNGV